jgi:hypothetical protein
MQSSADAIRTEQVPIPVLHLGKPVCPDAAQWPAFSVDSDKWMQFGAQVAPQPVSARPILNFLRKPVGKMSSFDTFQLPGLVADAMEAVDDLGVGAELQLIFDLLRINDTVTQ